MGGEYREPLKWHLHFDMRAPEWATPIDALYSTAVEMARWADEFGCPEIILSQHHAAEDGYLPSPHLLAGAFAAVTERTRLNLTALLLTLLDPVQAAEDTATLDVLSGGRVDVVVALGYRPIEFELFGLPMDQRSELIEHKLRIYLQALEGGEIDDGTRRGRISPLPLQRPRPPVLLGSNALAGARRAARLADGLMPTTTADQQVVAVYRAECERLGKTPTVIGGDAPFMVHVTDDPDRDWARIAPHAVHELNSYRRWAVEGDFRSGYEASLERGTFEPVDDPKAARETGLFAVMTPDEVIELAGRLQAAGSRRGIRLKPLLGGMSPELGWRGLEMFASKVLPRLDPCPPTPLAPLPTADI